MEEGATLAGAGAANTAPVTPPALPTTPAGGAPCVAAVGGGGGGGGGGGATVVTDVISAAALKFGPIVAKAGGALLETGVGATFAWTVWLDFDLSSSLPPS